MGRNLEASSQFSFPGLTMGIIFAIFHLLGENPSIQTAVIHSSEIIREDLEDTFILLASYPFDTRRFLVIHACNYASGFLNSKVFIVCGVH